MNFKITKDGIIVELLYCSKSEFKFICGALSSVITCKEKKITLLTNSIIVKNDKYEVRLEQFTEYQLNLWREKLHIIQLLLPFKCSLPLFPIHKVLEVKSKDQRFVKWECSCGCEANRNSFIFDTTSQKYLCPLCQKDPSRQHE